MLSDPSFLFLFPLKIITPTDYENKKNSFAFSQCRLQIIKTKETELYFWLSDADLFHALLNTNSL